MDALDYMRTSVTDQSVRCDVRRDQSSDSYSGPDYSTVGEVDVAIFDPSSSSVVVTEGSGEDTSLTGLVVPAYDTDGNLNERVHVNDRLRPQSNTAKLYEVRVKDGLPNEIDPDLWRLGLEHANQSE